MAVLHVIGSGTPTPTRHRFGTCCILELGQDLLMFDCGPASTHKLVKAGLLPTRIEHLFFTHHHFDHNADYPCFLLCRWDQSTGGQAILKVFGPPPTRRITDRLIGPRGAFVDDWKARVGHPTSQSVHRNRGGTLPRPEPRVEVADIGPGHVVRTGRWNVTAGAASHVEPWLTSLAYRVESGPLKIVFAGDTQPCRGVAELAAGCDVLVANCWDLQESMDANGEAPGQTGTRDAAAMARDCGARMLVLIHTGPRLASPSGRRKGLARIAGIYGGKVVFGRELMKVPL
jgi:ribonuclease BN (tRNA processing enzyme)